MWKMQCSVVISALTLAASVVNAQNEGCGLAVLDKCYRGFPLNGSTPDILVETVGEIPSVEECQWFCKELYSGECTWFAFDTKTNQCNIFKGNITDYTSSCELVGYTKEPNVAECSATLTGDDACYNFREGYCRFEDYVILENLQFVQLLEHCQEACRHRPDCKFILYEEKDKVCHLEGSQRRNCDVVHGLPDPPFADCLSANKIPFTIHDGTLTNTAQTTPAMTTSAPGVPMITVIGGVRDGSGLLSSVENFNPMDMDSNCPAISDLPGWIYEHIAQMINGTMVVCGGYTASRYEKRCLKYEAGTWSYTNPMTEARGRASSILLDDGKILIVGGTGGSSASTTAEIWSEHGTVEETKTMALPEQIQQTCMVRISPSQVLLAGNGMGGLKSSYLLNITSWPYTFSQNIPLSTFRRGAGCGLLTTYGVYKNLPIIVGGYSGSTSKTTEVFINSRWEPGPTLPRGFSYGGYTNNADGFFLVGGVDEKDPQQTPRKDVMWYDEESQQFKELEGQMETGRRLTAAIITSTDQC